MGGDLNEAQRHVSTTMAWAYLIGVTMDDYELQTPLISIQFCLKRGNYSTYRKRLREADVVLIDQLLALDARERIRRGTCVRCCRHAPHRTCR